MTCPDQTMKGRLNDYVDGVLSPDTSVHVRLHLESCESCREEVAALRDLLTDAATLPRSILPARDLWDGIEQRIGRWTDLDPHRQAGQVAERINSVSAPRFWRQWAPLAAAAILVLMGSTAVGIAIGRQLGTQPLPARGAPLAVPAEIQLLETDYQRAVTDLQRIIEEQRAILGPRTLAVLQRNLQIIDQAISESRAALAREPANTELATMLWATYQKKLDLLEQAARQRPTAELRS